MMMMMMEIDVTPSVVAAEIFLAYLLSWYVWTGKFRSLYAALCVRDVCNLLQKMVAPYGVVCSEWPFGCVNHVFCICGWSSCSRNWICTVTRLQAGWLWSLGLIPCRWEELWGPASLQWVPRSVSLEYIGSGVDLIIHLCLALMFRMHEALPWPIHACTETFLFYCWGGSVRNRILCLELFCLIECW
jgi:hypothetical protein